MLRLIRCEFLKLKRKKFVLFVVLAAFLFPIPFTALILSRKVGGIDAFDRLYELLLVVEVPVMLPCILGIIAAMLFFMERDNGTLKNVRTIPVSAWKIASAKIVVLYIIGLIYACATLLSSMAGGLIAGSDLGNISGKVWVTIVSALLYTTSVLPVVIAIVLFNRSYIFSIILTFFYTMFCFMIGFTGQIMSPVPVMRLLTNVLPTPLIYRWQAGQMIEPGTKSYVLWEPYLLPLWLAALNVFIIGALSYLAIIKIYGGQEE